MSGGRGGAQGRQVWRETSAERGAGGVPTGPLSAGVSLVSSNILVLQAASKVLLRKINNSRTSAD